MEISIDRQEMIKQRRCELPIWYSDHYYENKMQLSFHHVLVEPSALKVTSKMINS